MNLFLWAATPDLSYATTTLADLQLLIAALDDPSLPANAATIARVTDKIPALVQGDTGEPLVIASYDNATGTVSSWITDAGASVIACLGLADPVGDPLVTATDFSIVGSTRSGVLMLNTITLQQALQRLPARRATSGAFLLQIRKTVSGITETVALIPLTVSAGVLSSTPIADAEAASSAAASAASAAASAIATAADRVQTGLDRVATAADAVATAADRVQTGLDRVATAADVIATAADRVQTGLDRAATAADVVTAAASAAAALVSQGAASTSASAAASSATTALNAIISTFKGGVAGASVPSTSTAAGDYYRITSAGTSQSKTWTIGDLAIYNGSSGSWTQIPAGFVDETRALLGDFTRQIRDSLYSGGATSTRRAEWTPGTAGAVAALPVSFPFELQVPASNPSAGGEIITFAPTGTSASVASSFQVGMGASRNLVVRQNGAVFGTDFLRLEYTGFGTAYSGQWIRGMVVFDSPNTTTAPKIYLQGVDVTSSFTLTSGGTVNWMPSTLDTTKFVFGLNSPAWRFIPHGPILGALTAAEVLEWTQAGRLPAWCELGTGSAVAQTSGTLTIGWKYRISAYVAGDSFTNVGASSNATGVEFVATGATPTTWTNSSSLLKLGPIFKPVIQPIAVLADAGTNKIAGILTSGITPITEKRDWIIQASTNTNGNQQLLATSVFADVTKAVIDDWCMNTAGTPTVTAGSASAGTQYKSSGALAATRNMITLVTRVLATANLWCGSNDTSTIQHTITGHVVD